MQDTVDLLQIKIDDAKEKLPPDTLKAIETVDWKATILRLKETKGYSIEQLGNLETETELLLCGLVSSVQYPKELENRMGISKAQANELVHEMNELVFKKIREELIKISEEKKNKNHTERDTEDRGNPVPIIIRKETPKVETTPIQVDIDTGDTKILESAGISVAPLPTLESKAEIPPVSKEDRQDLLLKVEHPDVVHPIFGAKILTAVQKI